MCTIHQKSSSLSIFLVWFESTVYAGEEKEAWQEDLGERRYSFGANEKCFKYSTLHINLKNRNKSRREKRELIIYHFVNNEFHSNILKKF